MFTTKCCLLRSCIIRDKRFTSVKFKFQDHSRYQYSQLTQERWQTKSNSEKILSLFTEHRNWYSFGSFGRDDEGNIEDIKKIRSIFPDPRMTLNNLSAKTPQKPFDVFYKQHVVPKNAKKKSAQNLDWTCTYSFVWPEKKQFECTAVSKRKAGDAAAIQALQWLTNNKRIDATGHPIYDKETLDTVRSGLNEPYRARLSDASVERIERIWGDYENDIRVMYERTHEEAKHKVVHASKMVKESAVDEDEFSDREDVNEEITDTSEGTIHPIYGRPLRPPSQKAIQRKTEALQRSFEYYDENITALPIDKFAEEITSTVQNNQVTVIVGAAGCGKSTRVPALLMRGGGAVLVAEPRRVAATGLATRVAEELGEEVGASIGYQVRLDSKPPQPPLGSVLYCTSGILLNRLQTNPGLSGCTHVIIDEAHERDINTDISLLLLKRALKINPELKVVIMSATLDTGVFTRYFDSCPIVEVPGRTYPVKVSYVEDVQKKFNIQLPSTIANSQTGSKPQLNVAEIVETIKAVDKSGEEGAILVFLPGWAEIKLAKKMLDECYSQSAVHVILPVHSRLSTTEQSAMFSRPPPGVRKIVLSTNVAETSVTIPDVTHVVDAGACKENSLREGTGTASLETVWVSQAAARQRSGRAGRVQPGHCYRLYTKEKEAEFESHPTPEILRVPLEKTVLDCKSYAPDDKAQSFLSDLPEPPSGKAVEFAVKELIDIGALTPTEQLTRLGKALSSMQLCPRVGLGLLHAGALGTAAPVADLAAAADVELFLNAADRREEIREIKRSLSPTSDYAALWRLLMQFDEKSRASNKELRSWCEMYGVTRERMAYVKSLSNLYLSQLLRTGLIERTLEIEEMARFSDVDPLISATLLSAADSLLVGKRSVRTKGKLRTENRLYSTRGETAHTSSCSVNHGVRRARPLLVYTRARHSAERRALVVYQSAAVHGHAPLLFCRGAVRRMDIDEDTTVLTLTKHKLDIHVPTSQADTILKAREMLWKTLQYYIDRDVKTLDYDEHTFISRFKIRLVKAICKVLVEGHRQAFEGKIEKYNVDIDDDER